MRQSYFSIATLFSFFLLSSFLIQTAEVGKAGYYADSLQGRKTASGEKYDKFSYTCAHKTLAFGTKVRITRLDNHKSVVCKVNDRGPYVEGYVTDVSRAAAEDLDLLKAGVAKVKLEVVEAAATARVAAETDGNTSLLVARGTTKTSTKTSTLNKLASPAQYSNELQPAGRKGAVANDKTNSQLYGVDIKNMRKEGFGIQLSTLYDASNLLPTLKKVEQEWPGKAMVNVIQDELYNKSTYRLILGPYGDKKTAETQQKAAAKKGYKGCFVIDLSGI